ncbi:ribose transport system substrate-binding protein [Pseudobutyrivibrio sp. YE44]|uniref:sugar ABC transporter substrate-binding protein n=1 Tax=Pseudobutyrivibrio sp. YE44 TaxID=1520802 RepID=UPI000891D136|nr:substrate-binding domain-containing protein [Pseudobutyrivibrio sp. YE44]SDB23004.1 ribose transport system substrate-binding protein [Pseudobutyrivibrio sp. YE44]
MKLGGHKIKIKSSSALVVAAGCTVAFMFLTTCISFIFFRQRMNEANNLLREAKYSQYESYVVMISSDDDSDFWQRVYNSANEYGKSHGIYVDLLSDNVDVNYSKEELLEMAIESGCDAILLEGDDNPQTMELINSAASKGIAVITLENDVTGSRRVSFVGVNNYTIAQLYAKSLMDNITKQKHVMVIGDNTINETVAGNFVNNMQEALSGEDIVNAPLEFDIRIIEDNNAFAAEEYIQNLFMKNELAPVVICLDATSTESFYQSMIDYNKVGQVLLFGNYESQAIYTGIQQGVIKSTVTLDADSMGKTAVKAFEEYRDSGYVSDYINVEPRLINSKNVEDFLKKENDNE